MRPFAALVLLTLGLALAHVGCNARESPSAFLGFPCRDDQWLPANWTAGDGAECQSCYVCTRGTECIQRGGCVPCGRDSIDHDSMPTTRCEPCDGDRISHDALHCVAAESSWSSWWLWLKDKADELAAVLGVAILVVAACLGQDAAEAGLAGCCGWVASVLTGRRRAGSRTNVLVDGDQAEPDDVTCIETTELLDVNVSVSDTYLTPRPQNASPRRLSPVENDDTATRLASQPTAHRRQRSGDSSAEFFSPSVAADGTSASNESSPEYLTPRLRAASGVALLAADLFSKRRNSEVWTPSPSLQRQRTV